MIKFPSAHTLTPQIYTFSPLLCASSESKQLLACAFISLKQLKKQRSFFAPLQAFFHTSNHEYLIGEPRLLSEKNCWVNSVQG